jgi:hypothetical protein
MAFASFDAIAHTSIHLGGGMQPLGSKVNYGN